MREKLGDKEKAYHNNALQKHGNKEENTRAYKE